MKFQLSWTHATDGGNTPDPKWHDVERKLSSALSSSGTVQLDVVDPPEIGPVLLQLSSESGRFLIMLGENTDDDYDVRTPYDAARGDEMVTILGNEWDNRTITNDRSFVVSSFRHFFDVGTVPPDTLV